MIPSIEFNITEGLAKKFANMLKHQKMLAVSASNLLSFHSSHETLAEAKNTPAQLQPWDEESMLAIQTKCWEAFHRSKNLVAAILQGIESMQLYLAQFKINKESRARLEQELKSIKPNKDGHLLIQAELIIYIDFCKSQLEHDLAHLRMFVSTALTKELDCFETAPWSLGYCVYLRGLSEVLAEWGGLDPYFLEELERLGCD